MTEFGFRVRYFWNLVWRCYFSTESPGRNQNLLVRSRLREKKYPRRLRLGGFVVFIDAGCWSGVKGRVRNWFCFSKRHHDWSLWHHGHQPVQCGNSRRHAGGYFSSQLRSRTPWNEIHATPSGAKWTRLGAPPPVGRTATPWRGPFALVIFGGVYGSPSGHKTERHSRHAPPSATAYGLAPNGWRGPHEPQPERVAPLATPLRRHEWHAVIASADGPPSSAPSTAPPAAPPPPASPSSPRWSSPPWSEGSSPRWRRVGGRSP